MKAWFPTCSGMENIMRKIIFEDISFSYSCPNTKKEAELRIKDGCTFEEICQNLNLLKNDITTFYEKIYRDFGIIEDDELPKKPTHINKYIIPTAEKKKIGCYDDSDEEADLRVENSKFVAPDYRGKKDGNVVATIKKRPAAKKFEIEKRKEFFDFAEKYRLLPDSDVDEFDLEMKEIDVGHGIIKEALKKAIEKSKPENDDAEVEKNDDSIKIPEYFDSSDSD
uniref:Uncharacterized protein n=1 Tax=Panagrolaimus davidi TaxID=227884 RepID=A0A914Q3U8_9BILA